jgi:hypothetical protein
MFAKNSAPNKRQETQKIKMAKPSAKHLLTKGSKCGILTCYDEDFRRELKSSRNRTSSLKKGSFLKSKRHTVQDKKVIAYGVLITTG